MAIKKNKRGWIKIVEVFISILLVVSVLLIVLNKGYIGRDISSQVQEAELSILRGIQLDEEFRGKILDINSNSLPVHWNDFDSMGLGEIKNKINNDAPKYLICEAGVCNLTDSCLLNRPINKNVYTQYVVITANYQVFSPRQLKLFCWES